MAARAAGSLREGAGPRGQPGPAAAGGSCRSGALRRGSTGRGSLTLRQGWRGPADTMNLVVCLFFLNDKHPRRADLTGPTLAKEESHRGEGP